MDLYYVTLQTPPASTSLLKEQSRKRASLHFEREKKGVIYIDGSEFANGESRHVLMCFPNQRAPGHSLDAAGGHRAMHRIVSHTATAQPPERRNVAGPKRAYGREKRDQTGQGGRAQREARGVGCAAQIGLPSRAFRLSPGCRDGRTSLKAGHCRPEWISL